MYEPLQLLEVSDLTWPLSWRFHLSGPFGASQCELSVDAPSLFDKLEESKRLGALLFSAGIAPAMSSSVQVDFLETVIWKATPLPFVSGADGLQGTRLSGGFGRAHAGVLCLHTGHHDRYGMRRFHCAGMPTGWASGGLLSTGGAERLQEIARGWIAGMGVECGASDPVLLNRYRNVIPTLPPLPYSTGFRYVRHIRVCQHTSPVPEQGDPGWPY